MAPRCGCNWSEDVTAVGQRANVVCRSLMIDARLDDHPRTSDPTSHGFCERMNWQVIDPQTEPHLNTSRTGRASPKRSAASGKH